MEIIKTVKLMQSTSKRLRSSDHKLALVPTMGFFHEGHLELMRVAKRHCNDLIVSIFVNPMQFGPSEDYEVYPRDIKGDLEKAHKVGADIIFMPPAEEIYPDGFQTKVLVKDITQHLCGISRPTHFVGVTTVVAKLFNITMPHLAVFGEKDYQQLQVIRRMVKDLNMDIEIMGVPTVREPDGLAMSSRNNYLSPKERKAALCLKRALDISNDMFNRGVRDAGAIKDTMESLILKQPFTRVEYISLCDPLTLEEVTVLGDTALVALAVRIGKTRLIDNSLLQK